MLSVWWDFKGIVYFELLPRNRTINSNVYCRQIMKLDEEIKEKRPELENGKGVILHQDNARPHNTWINKSRDWHIDGVANRGSVWFFMSTDHQKIPVKISWHSDVWSTSYSDLSDASLDILKTMDSKQFRVLIYHWFLMKKKHSASSSMAWKVLRGLCSIKKNHLSVVFWV